MRAALLILFGLTGCAESASTGAEPTPPPPPAASAEPAAPAEVVATPAPDPADAPAPPETAPPAPPLVETIPGTTLSIELLPVAPLPGLYVSKTEITWELYDAFVFGLDQPAPDAIVRPSKPYVLADYGFGHAGYPVICASPKGAEAFCAWLTARTGRRHRLPTEAEWEAVCRAARREPLLDHAWLKDNSGKKSHPVASKAPDALGLHDLLGNVTEWCTTADGGHVARGGCWKDPAEGLDCAARKVPDKSWNKTDPQLPKSQWWLADANFAGFRVVCEVRP
ncbi:MAG TPA: SUMF1/EgtB/PvdO family nonheme iron enzyme [Planctomycetota bacterium]|nr:SUMF1/EgtB/PvdO family nonheme iron enzyme [Planctomycetota bacterium]